MTPRLFEAHLIRLGGAYERAYESCQFDAMIALEQEIGKLQAEQPEAWLTPWLVRGRNVIRRCRGLEDING